jgi:glutamate-1-semialdehyde 2,1-aminomutase
MAVFDPSKGKPKAPHAGTFNGNPVTMAAGAAAVHLLTRERIEHINRLGERARTQLAEAFRMAGMPGQVTGGGSLFRLHLTTARLSDYRTAYQPAPEKRKLDALVDYLFDDGVIISPIGVGNISTVMTEAEVDQMVESVLGGLRFLSGAMEAAE